MADESTYLKLQDWIRQGHIRIEVNQAGPRPLLKALWLKFCYAYVRSRAVRDFEFFENVYKSEIIRLRLEDGKIISHPRYLLIIWRLPLP